MEKTTAERVHKIITLMNNTQHEINVNKDLKAELKETDYSDGRCMETLDAFLQHAEARYAACAMEHRVRKALYKRIWEAIEKHLDDDIAYLEKQISCGEKMIAEL